MFLTYFQVDVRVQFFQLVRHTVSLDASQLGQKEHSSASLKLDCTNRKCQSTPPQSQCPSNQYGRLEEEQLSYKDIVEPELYYLRMKSARHLALLYLHQHGGTSHKSFNRHTKAL